jgi:hypothetical protein
MPGGLGRASNWACGNDVAVCRAGRLRNGEGLGPVRLMPQTTGNLAWRHLVADPGTSRHIEIRDGDQTVAAAEVTTSPDADGTAQASLHAASGHIAPGSRASLVDAVMDLPEVQHSARLKAAVPLGDTESLWRLRERTDDTVTRAAGSTALVDANIPPGGEPESGQEPGGETPAP